MLTHGGMKLSVNQGYVSAIVNSRTCSCSRNVTINSKRVRFSFENIIQAHALKQGRVPPFLEYNDQFKERILLF